jgi:hypothetical protein
MYYFMINVICLIILDVVYRLYITQIIHQLRGRKLMRNNIWGVQERKRLNTDVIGH